MLSMGITKAKKKKSGNHNGGGPGGDNGQKLEMGPSIKTVMTLIIMKLLNGLRGHLVLQFHGENRLF